MIIYDLCCDGGHRFEGWFRDAEDFSAQNGGERLTCPVCESSAVRRVPSAVALAKVSHAGAADHREPPERQSFAATVPPSATQVLAAYRQFLAVLKANSVDVGRGFADEARRIHAGELPERAIRGEATAEECAELADEGIDVLRLPDIGSEGLN